jgi:hypothetical protein
LEPAGRQAGRRRIYIGTDIEQGNSIALSADGNTAIEGELDDNNWLGAAWVFTRKAGVWTQQAGKLVGSGAVGPYSRQGSSVAVSSDGNTAIVGGVSDNGGGIDSNGVGAAWVFKRGNGVWTQQGGKLVGSGAIGSSAEGGSVALSGDGAAAIVGGPLDNSYAGAAWAFLQPLQVSPYPGAAASGAKGGPFSPSSFKYTLAAASGSPGYTITGLPAWLTASSTSGTATQAGATIKFKINAAANTLAPGAHAAIIAIANTNGKQKAITRAVTLTVNAK